MSDKDNRTFTADLYEFPNGYSAVVTVSDANGNYRGDSCNEAIVRTLEEAENFIRSEWIKYCIKPDGEDSSENGANTPI